MIHLIIYAYIATSKEFLICVGMMIHINLNVKFAINLCKKQ